jgi:hypothetical protein
VGLSRADRDVQLLRYLLIRVTEREEAQDLALAVGERVCFGAAFGFALCSDEACTELRVHIAPTGRDLTDRGDNLGVGSLFQDVAARARSECLLDVLGIVLHREDEHLRLRMLVQERRKNVEAALVWHDDVEQDHVGSRRTRLEDRIARGSRLAHRL